MLFYLLNANIHMCLLYLWLAVCGIQKLWQNSTTILYLSNIYEFFAGIVDNLFGKLFTNRMNVAAKR